VDVRDHKLGATFRLAVRPGAGRTRALGEHGGALRLAVAAPPERGKANKQALRYLAKALKLFPADLELLGGSLSRQKVVLCRGLGPRELEGRLAKLIEEGGDKRRGRQ
jgi:uncharacterized protein (TIGR00251 family)